MCLSVKVARPNDVLAEGEHAGYQWTVTHNGMGFRCGYVRVPPGHPWHGKDYNDVYADVHGGLTFAKPDVKCGDGKEDDGYWLGFDCGHHSDAQDPTLPRDHVYEWGGEVRTQEYVESECRSLCEQAAAAAK